MQSSPDQKQIETFFIDLSINLLQQMKKNLLQQMKKKIYINKENQTAMFLITNVTKTHSYQI